MTLFISFEGGDGSGKTTQLRLLEEYLCGQGRTCLSTREPGGTALGQMIRRVLVEVGGSELASPTELFLYLADRSHHVQEIIQPALSHGKLILCDRFADSTLAYQGFGRGVDLKLVRQLNQIASRGMQPDLTLLLDSPVELGLARTRDRGGEQREDRFEREELEFHERVRRGYLKLAEEEPGRIYVLDASLPIQDVHERIRRIVDQKLASG
ncbi:MAG: dTMP kinase [Deltaproteobacteria bacterium]|nr:dTMP kinase [Deltaproteobacteria bacterium]